MVFMHLGKEFLFNKLQPLKYVEILSISQQNQDGKILFMHDNNIKHRISDTDVYIQSKNITDAINKLNINLYFYQRIYECLNTNELFQDVSKTK